MPIIRDEFDQSSVEWMIARAGLVTASEFDQLVTPEFKPRTGQMPQTYLAKKVAERWQGGPLPGFNVLDMDLGHILEEEAIPWFELENNTAVRRVGLVTTDDGLVGCSPDGLIGEDSGIEIKCPLAQTHVGYLLAGELPKDYAAQVHGSMWVTGRTSWRFLSYRRHFPALLITVERDEEIQNKISDAMLPFLLKLETAMKRMEELNGGPAPQRFNVKAITEPEASFDVIP